MNPVLDEISSPYAGKEKAIENLGGLTALYEKHLSRFRETYRDSADSLTRMLSSGQIEDARILAHSIKGLAGTLGLTRLQYAAGDLEQSIKTQDPSGHVLRTFSQCLAEILE